MSVAEMNGTSVNALEAETESSYRALVDRVAGGGQVAQEDRSLLVICGRSVGQLRADADRLIARRKAKADLDRAIALDGETAAIHAARDQAVAAAAQAREAAAAEFKRIVDEARAAFDKAVGEANKSETDAQARLVDHRQTVGHLRGGKAEMLIATAQGDIAQRIDALHKRRQAPAGVVSLANRGTTTLEAEAVALEQEAKTIDRQVDAYEAVGRMSDDERIAIISPDAAPVGNSGGSSQAGATHATWRFPMPKWLFYGETKCGYRDGFLSQVNPAIAEKGRQAAAELREQAAAVRAKIADIEQARKQAPAASKMLAAIDAEIAKLQREQLEPSRFALTG